MTDLAKFRADHVGSLLRPPELLRARRRHEAGEITGGELRAAEDEAILWDSLVLCKFVRGCFVDFATEAAELWSAVSGLDLEAEELRARAKSTWARKRRINARLGWTPADDTLPARLFEAICDGPHAGRCVEAEKLAVLQKVYEAERGIDRRCAAAQAAIREV